MNIDLAQFAHLARTRRSIRAYTGQPIAKSLLYKLLETATWSPSAHNRQPWRFVAITTPAVQENLARAMGAQLRRDLEADDVPEDVITADVERSYKRITSAAAVVCVCTSLVDMDSYPDPRRQHNETVMAIQSTAMAGQNFLLAAHAAGLGACWMCAPLFCPDIVREVLDLPGDWQPQGLITLGYPAQTRQRSRHRVETRTLWR